jgi:hypothetical protein
MTAFDALKPLSQLPLYELEEDCWCDFHDSDTRVECSVDCTFRLLGEGIETWKAVGTGTYTDLELQYWEIEVDDYNTTGPDYDTTEVLEFYGENSTDQEFLESCHDIRNAPWVPDTSDFGDYAVVVNGSFQAFFDDGSDAETYGEMVQATSDREDLYGDVEVYEKRDLDDLAYEAEEDDVDFDPEDVDWSDLDNWVLM